MPWTERQRAMLGEMGLAVWQPVDAASAVVAGEPPAPSGAGQRAQVAPAAVVTPAAARAPAGAAPAAAGHRAAPSAEFAIVHTSAHTSADTSERHAAIARMEWPELRAAVPACTACSLCGSRTQTVFGSGHERAAWMVVGEAPSEDEDQQGQPFVGAAGRLLDRMLLALGLDRNSTQAERAVYIVNTLKCRPPRNRNPGPLELAQCLPFLERQVALVQPRVILAMGHFAAQALLGSQEPIGRLRGQEPIGRLRGQVPIGRLRGQVHRWRDTPVVVTYHPAYLLRQPSEKARAWADLCLAADQVERAAAP